MATNGNEAVVTPKTSTKPRTPVFNSRFTGTVLDLSPGERAARTARRMQLVRAVAGGLHIGDSGGN